MKQKRPKAEVKWVNKNDQQRRIDSEDLRDTVELDMARRRAKRFRDYDAIRQELVRTGRL